MTAPFYLTKLLTPFFAPGASIVNTSSSRDRMSPAAQAIRAINTFKDEYLLDYINVEELGIRDRQDVDERVVENAIIHNVKRIPTSV